MLAHDPAHTAKLKMVLLKLNPRMHGGFDKVVKMVADMVATHGRDQVDDDKKKDSCIAELNKVEMRKRR